MAQDFPAGIGLQHFAPDGSNNWSIIRRPIDDQTSDGFAVIGNDLRDLRIAPDGRVGIFAHYYGFAYDPTDIIQLYTP